MHDGWAATRRRRWSAWRIAAAIALHALVLVSLRLAIDRVQLPRRSADRATTLVDVVLHRAPPPLHAVPLPKPARARSRPRPRASRAPDAAPRPRRAEPQAIALPAPAIAAATPAASAPRAGLAFLDSAATRQAIHDAAHGTTLASQGNAITSTEQTAGERLAKNVEAAHRADCMKGNGMGLLGLPFLLAAEALGKCAHKL
jgi:hypothetical protein